MSPCASWLRPPDAAEGGRPSRAALPVSARDRPPLSCCACCARPRMTPHPVARYAYHQLMRTFLPEARCAARSSARAAAPGMQAVTSARTCRGTGTSQCPRSMSSTGRPAPAVMQLHWMVDGEGPAGRQCSPAPLDIAFLAHIRGCRRLSATTLWPYHGPIFTGVQHLSVCSWTPLPTFGLNDSSVD